MRPRECGPNVFGASGSSERQRGSNRVQESLIYSTRKLVLGFCFLYSPFVFIHPRRTAARRDLSAASAQKPFAVWPSWCRSLASGVHSHSESGLFLKFNRSRQGGDVSRRQRVWDIFRKILNFESGRNLVAVNSPRVNNALNLIFNCWMSCWMSCLMFC